MDSPTEQAVRHAITELTALKAIDEEENLTSLGWALSRVPLNPQFGIELLFGYWYFHLGDAMALICAAMSFDEPFAFEKNGGYISWRLQENFAGKHKHSDQMLLARVHQEYANRF